jgi:LysM repeat protein
LRQKVIGLLSAFTLAWAVPAAAAQSPWTARYAVRTGDSLTAIAQHYHVSLQALAAANGLDWRKPLLVGVILRVPATGSKAVAWNGTYVVRGGDTLSGLALHYNVPLAQLASVNRLDSTRVLLIGTRLQVPTTAGSTLDLSHIVQSNPYRQGAVGYDISYPNCAAGVLATREFAVIGLNQGRPFTANPCFASEWAAAQRPRSVYINTAYSPTLLRHITADCDATGRSQPFRRAAQRAYAVGCSEGVAALELRGATFPLAIWLDVEPGNSWSSRRSLNAATIKGIIDHLLTQSPHPVIGVYSNVSIWRRIVGPWTSLSVPEWVATGAPDPPGCPAGFAGGPVWLSQSTDPRLDLDTAC